MNYRVLTALLLLSASALAQTAPTLDETAHFLAGMPVTGVLEPLTHDPAWQEHAQAMNEAWTRKERQQVWPIRQWMQANAPQYHRSNDTVFYMFSGPDFLYASIFFPLSSNYVLAGLEPIGNVPDLTHVPPEMLHADLISLRNSMNSILRFQYFITKEMRVDLGRGNIGGTLPILYVFLRRLGYTINDVTRVTSPAEGVKITFSGGEQPQTLYYFKTDLSGRNSAFLRWCAAPRARSEFAQGRLIPHAWRRILRRPQFPLPKQSRHHSGRLRDSATDVSQRLESELLRALRCASRGIREVSPA
jgi:hypothetical protein